MVAPLLVDKEEKMAGRSRRFWHVAFLAVLIYVGLFGATVLYINLCERPETDTIRIATSTPSLRLRASVWVWDHLHWVLPILMLGNVLAAVGFWLRLEDRPAAVCLIVYSVLQSLMLIFGSVATWVVVSNNRAGSIVSTGPAGEHAQVCCGRHGLSCVQPPAAASRGTRRLGSSEAREMRSQSRGIHATSRGPDRPGAAMVGTAVRRIGFNAPRLALTPA